MLLLFDAEFMSVINLTAVFEQDQNRGGWSDGWCMQPLVPGYDCKTFRCYRCSIADCNRYWYRSADLGNCCSPKLVNLL